MAFETVCKIDSVITLLTLRVSFQINLTSSSCKTKTSFKFLFTSFHTIKKILNFREQKSKKYSKFIICVHPD
jgi:hypothetical protein